MKYSPWALTFFLIIILFIDYHEKILYHPTQSKYKGKNIIKYKGIAFKLHVMNENAKSVVIFSHGSLGHINVLDCYISKIANIYPQSDILMYDYSDYGESKSVNGSRSDSYENISSNRVQAEMGEISITNLYASDALSIYEMARGLYEEVILWGESIGGLVTARLYEYLVRKNMPLPKEIVHQESIYDIYHTIKNIIPMLKFIAYITKPAYNISIAKIYKDIKVPLTIYHSVDDDIVDYNDAMQLIDELPKNKVKFIKLKGRHCQFELVDTTVL